MPTPTSEASPPDRDPAGAAFLARLRARAWRLLPLEEASGSLQMERDVALLEAAAREAIPPTLRFYTWSPPAVSLGRFQRPDEVRLEYARLRGWDVVRRPTGGGAVLHQWEVTYAIALPPSVVAGAGVRTSYRVLGRGLAAGIALLLGEPALAVEVAGGGGRSREANCFARVCPCDTAVPAGKLAGSAQARREGALLQHGSILLDADREAWAALFGSAGRLITLRELLGEAPAPAQVAAALAEGFRRLGLRLVAEPESDRSGKSDTPASARPAPSAPPVAAARGVECD